MKPNKADKPQENEAWLREALERFGLTLRDEDAAPALATARFLAEAARRIRAASS